jgi:phenylacetate-CoA ligase
VTSFAQSLLTRKLVLPAICRRGDLDQSAYLAELTAFDKLPARRRRELSLERLRAVLEHANHRSLHYRDAFAQAGISVADVRNEADLARLPILTKADLRSKPLDHFTTGEIRGSRFVETAGTSGQPVRVHSNWNAYGRMLLRRAHEYRALGIAIGDREARFWGRAPKRKREFLLGLLANRRVFMFQQDGRSTPEAEARDLVGFRPDYAYGYSSLLLRAADYLARSGIRAPQLKAVICTSETLLPSQAGRIAEVFGCPVTMEYGCSEIDVIAFGCPRGNYHVLEHHVLLESVVVEDGGKPEVVVTDLDNLLMPIIRYRIGDHVQILDGKCPCGRDGQVLSAVEGRTLNQMIRHPDGRTLHAVVLAHAIEALCAESIRIDRFKVYQTAVDELTVRVEGPSPEERDAAAAAIKAMFNRKLSDDFIIKVEFGLVEQKPGEKFTYFVPLAAAGPVR